MWEENDVIALHQMAAAGGSASADKAELAIKEGWGTQNARFGAEVELTTADNRYFCFAYPSTAAAFSTSDAIEAVGTIDYSFKQSTPGIGHYTASGTYKHVYTTSCGITIPTVQHGKWEPYMYAFTGESKPAEQLGSFRFKTLNGAICLRVSAKDAGGNTKSKQLKEIIITSDKPIAGTFTCKSTSEGMLEPQTGDEGKVISTSLNDQEGRDDAREKLENKARAASPASTTATTDNSNPSWSFSEGHNAITVTGLENIEPENGEYLYYINIAPVTGAKLKITMKDIDDFECSVETKALTLEANHRKGYDITWKNSIAVEFDDQSTGELTTTYSSYLKGDIAAANNADNTHTISGATIKGKTILRGYEQSQITEYGCSLKKIETTKDAAGNEVKTEVEVQTQKSNDAFALTFADIKNQPLGEYVYYLYVTTDDGETFTSDQKHIYITGLPYTCNVSQNDGWTLSGDVRFESSYIELHQNNNGSSIERTFYVPADANINVIANSDFGCRKGRSNDNIFYLYIGGTEAGKQGGHYYYPGQINGTPYTNNMHHFIDKSGVLTRDKNSIKMHTTGKNLECYTRISSFKLTYGAK